MMPGAGIGPEMMEHVKHVFKVMGAPVDFEMVHLDPELDNYDDLYNVGGSTTCVVGLAVFLASHQNLNFFEQAISSVRRNGCAIKANIDTRLNQPHIKSRNVELRNELDLFANILHCKSVDSIKTRHKDVDIVVIRQNTGGRGRRAP